MARPLQPIEKRFWAKVYKTDTCWLWIGGTSPFGHGRIFVRYVNGRQRIFTAAHRVSWILHHGPIPEHLLVLHRCDMPSCVNPEHLFLGTHQDNTTDMFAKGRWRLPRHVRHGGAARKLTFDQARSIRQRIAAGEQQKDIARELAVSRSTISRIARDRTYAHEPSRNQIQADL